MTQPDVGVMRDLLAKVKTASGPDRWIDAEVHTALFPDDAFGRAIQEATRLTAAEKHEQFVEVPGVRMRAGSSVGSARLPAVSASTDAALHLVERALPGWGGRVAFAPSGATARLWHLQQSDKIPAVDGATPALALLAGTLTALIAAEDRHG